MKSASHPVSGSPSAGRKILSDIRLLARFVSAWCRDHHGTDAMVPVKVYGVTGRFVNGLKVSLCPECKRIFLHGATKRILCPFDPKPRCRRCPTPCYGDGYRETMKAVMRYSGLRAIRRGRLDYVFDYFTS